MADLRSEQKSLLQLSPQQALELVLEVRRRRREQRIEQAKARTAKPKKPVDLSNLSIEQLQKLLEIANERGGG